MSPRTSSAEISTTDPEVLVSLLNELLVVLSLEQIRLESPQDLTPSLLLAMLESMLRARLPIAQTTRDARTRTARVGAMKVFLAVLEADVMQEDVGLADVDPRRLADGEWAECVFVGELLVWLARDMGYLPMPADEEQKQQQQQRAESSSMGLAASDSSTKRPAMHAHKDSVTSMRTADSNPFIVRPRRRRPPPPDGSSNFSAHRSYSPPSPIPSSHPSRTPSPTTDSLGLTFQPPRASSPARLGSDDEGQDETQLCSCGPDASFASSATFCTCSHAGDQGLPDSPPSSFAPSRRRDSTPTAATGRRPSLPADRHTPPTRTGSKRPSPSLDPAASAAKTPVRYDGWIERVEGDVEAFESARARGTERSHGLARSREHAALGAPGGRFPPGSRRNPTRHVSPAQHTLALMNERARLLGELAKIRTKH